jgi:hypothetical protein
MVFVVISPYFKSTILFCCVLCRSSVQKNRVSTCRGNILGLKSLGERQTYFYLSLFVVIVFMTVLRKDGKICIFSYVDIAGCIWNTLVSSRSLIRSWYVAPRHYWQFAILRTRGPKMGRSYVISNIDFPRNTEHMEPFFLSVCFFNFVDIHSMIMMIVIHDTRGGKNKFTLNSPLNSYFSKRFGFCSKLE